VVYDYCVVGGGIVGLATAYKLQQAHAGATVLVLEKEHTLAAHQTGHNSGVIHAGIYYPPGSLKARLCKKGAAETKRFAAENAIPYEVRGKLLVATSSREMDRMRALFQRSGQHELSVELIDSTELRRREPHITGLGALYVRDTGIIDYRAVARALGAAVEKAGGEIVLGARVEGIHETPSQVEVEVGGQTYRAARLVACAGLQSDRIARLAGLEIDFQIVPFRGEYFHLAPHLVDLVHHLIYPIPDPDLPFLGVHLTPTIGGGLTVGPNAVLGFAREGYPKWSFAHQDVAEYLRFAGMRRVARANIRTGARELRNSLFMRGYLRECRKYCPELSVGDLLPASAGIRAQAVQRDGTLVHDFLFARTERMLHVCNAPSPAATAALPIGAAIVAKLAGEGAIPRRES